MNPTLVPLQSCRDEMVVMKSRFIATLFPVATPEDVRQRLAQVRAEFPDANHHPYAYVLNPAMAQEHSSDDGEPGGTAGRPILQAIKNRGIAQVLVVVTRYFGGIKLGTAGLAKTYRESAQGVLDKAVLGRKMRVSLLSLTIPYSWYERVSQYAHQANFHILEKDFREVVQMTLQVPESELETCRASLHDLTQGQAIIHLVESSVECIVPLP
jgi:uncharacterized YigZ family protein